MGVSKICWSAVGQMFEIEQTSVSLTVWKNTKVNQMRSPLHPKIRIFDLEGLKDVESKNILSKNWRNNQNLKLLKKQNFSIWWFQVKKFQ